MRKKIRSDIRIIWESGCVPARGGRFECKGTIETRGAVDPLIAPPMTGWKWEKAYD
jgi:hypothetical protein